MIKFKSNFVIISIIIFTVAIGNNAYARREREGAFNRGGPPGGFHPQTQRNFRVHYTPPARSSAFYANHMQGAHHATVHTATLHATSTSPIQSTTHPHAFSHANFRMNPHQGIPNSTFATRNASVPNMHSAQNGVNNNWNYHGNSNWNHWGWNGSGWHNWGWNGNNNGWLFAAIGTSLLSSYAFFNSPYPYYPYPYEYDSYNSLYLYQPNYALPYYEETIYAPVSYAHSEAPLIQNQPIRQNAEPISSNEAWIPAQNGQVPQNGVVNTNENGNMTYYCRAKYMNIINYGVLVPNDGCYIETSSVTMRFTNYDVLVIKR